MPRLLAISDLHVRHKANRAAVESVSEHLDDWLIVAGDVGEKPDELARTLDSLGPRFARLLWVPGNHELWAPRKDPLRGVARYEALVALCRERGVDTPEDPWPIFEDGGRRWQVALLFLMYDYSFAPPGLDPEAAVRWAGEAGIVCADELRLDPTPFPSRQAWCADRLARARARLESEDPGLPRVLVNHWPLRRDLVRIPRVPRFLPWCGTQETEDWHLRYRADVVVSGHLHVRATDWRDGVRFEEVSLGYPRHWNPDLHLDELLRPIVPGPRPPSEPEPDPVWHRLGGPPRRRDR